MNIENQKAEYFNRKAKIADINDKISETNTAANDLKRQIHEANDVIRITTKRLEIEEREITIPGSLSKRTMTVEQFSEHKEGLEDWKKGLPKLNYDFNLLNQELTILKAELATERRALNATRSKIVSEMVDKAADEFSAVSSESFKNLVLTIIANAGKDKGYTANQQQLFNEVMYKLICEKIVPSVFSDRSGLPDLQEANQYITSIIEGPA
jgi:chromosome segregation ATPase